MLCLSLIDVKYPVQRTSSNEAADTTADCFRSDAAVGTAPRLILMGRLLDASFFRFAPEGG